MKKTSYIAFWAGLFSFSQPVWGARQELTLGLDLQGRSVQDRTLSTQVFGLKFVATHQRQWVKSLESNIQLRSDIETGSGYSAFSDPYGARQRFVLEEAALSFIPATPVVLKVGALSHRALKSPLLIDSKAFLGIAESVRIPIQDFFFELTAEQTLVPGNSSALWPDDRGIVPSFFLERLRAGYAPKYGFNGAVHASHFRFSGLGNDLATEARILGNSVIGLGKTNNRFAASFEGIEGGLEVGYRTDRLFSVAFLLVGHANFRTAENRARALAAILSAQIPMSDSFALSPEVAVFHVESDAAPANFVRTEWGHTNRRGFSLVAGATFPRDGIHVKLRYTEASAIAPSTFQSDFQFIGAEFGVEYGLL